ncbi:MAG: hypothetical protein K2Q26_08955 [Bdellovibrionales bacterium]|nr:hypothetical protein [Bdellovibrionales bacterium]
MKKIKEFLKNLKIEKLPDGVHSQWVSLNRLLTFYRFMSVAMFFIALITWVMMAFFLLKDPVVVILGKTTKTWVQGQKKSVPIETEDIIETVKKFIEGRYEWKKLNWQDMRYRLFPVVTQGLFDKLEADVSLFLKKEFSKKPFEQTVANILVQVSEKSITATFDRIIRLDGLPLVAPLTLTLSLSRGSMTPENPIGLYINGIIEHQRN